MLLKNEDVGGTKRLLPLDAGALKKVVVMGPHARATEVLMGNYYGIPARRITSPLEALQVPWADVDACHIAASPVEPNVPIKSTTPKRA